MKRGAPGVWGEKKTRRQGRANPEAGQRLTTLKGFDTLKVLMSSGDSVDCFARHSQSRLRAHNPFGVWLACNGQYLPWCKAWGGYHFATG